MTARPSQPPVDHRRLWLFGTLRTAAAGVPEGRVLHGERLRSLLGFLACHGDRAHTREALSGMLWPEADPERARRNLSDTLYRLREIVGPGWFEVDGSYVRLAVGPDLWVDSWSFESALADDAAAVEDAVALYTDDLLRDLYDDWVIPLRERLRERFLDALRTLGEQREEQQDWPAAFEHYHRLTYVDPLGEVGFVGLIRVLEAMGRPVEALAAYRRLAETLERELDIAPGPAAQALAAGLQRELTGRPTLLGTVSPEPSPGRRRGAPPFVGRLEERTALLAHLSQARDGRGGMVLVMGPSGIGKTRLLDEVATAAAWHGFEVARGTGDARSGGPPYTPLCEALEAALDDPERRSAVARQLEPIWLRLLARMVPGLDEGPSGVPEALANQGESSLARALGRVLHALGQRAPQLWVLDDMQWADAAVWPVLAALRPRLSTLPVSILLAARESQDAAAGQYETTWLDGLPWAPDQVPILRLAGLRSGELRDLVLNVARAPWGGRQLANLEAATGGNPLAVLSQLRGGEVGAGMTRTGTTVEVAGDAGVGRRLEELDPTARRAVQAAAVLGPRPERAIWRAVLDQLGMTVTAELEASLAAADWLLPEGSLICFEHDSVQAAVVASLSSEERTHLHRVAAAVLAEQAPDRALIRLHHARAAGMAAETRDLALQSGQRALADRRLAAAIELFQEALDGSEAKDTTSRFEAWRGLCRAHYLASDLAALTAALRELAALSAAIDQPASWAVYHSRAAESAILHGDLDAAESHAADGIRRAREAGDARAEAKLLELSAHAARDRGDLEAARGYVERALAASRRAGDALGKARLLDKRANLDYMAGDYEAAGRGHAAAAGHFAELGATVEAANARNGQALVLQSTGDLAGAQQLHRQILSVMDEFALDSMVYVQRVNLGNLALHLGDPLGAIEHYEAGATLCRAAGQPRPLALTLNNLGNPYREIGDHETAARYHREALALNREHGFELGLAYAQAGLGHVFLDTGRHREAHQAYRQALEQFSASGVSDQIVAMQAGLAMTAAALGDHAAARQHLEGAQDSPAATGRESIAVGLAGCKVHDAAGESGEARRQLRAAVQSLRERALLLPPAMRERYLTRVGRNAEVLRLAAAHGLDTRVASTRLARRTAPLGRPLGPEEMVEIAWTIEAAEDRVLPKVEQRHYALRRLCREAAAQDAAPTDQDLADALGVSRRTVLRDVENLRREGVALATRRRVGTGRAVGLMGAGRRADLTRRRGGGVGGQGARQDRPP